MKLLHTYPDLTLSNEELEAENEKRISKVKTAQKQLIIACVLLLAFVAAVIVCPSSFGRLAILPAVIIMLALTAVMWFNLHAVSDPDIYVKIYDDRISSFQPSPFGFKKPKVELMYDDVERSNQDFLGSVVFYLKDGSTQKITFQSTDSKLFLIQNLGDKIGYPKKQYIDYSNEDTDEDEDDDSKEQ